MTGLELLHSTGTRVLNTRLVPACVLRSARHGDRRAQAANRLVGRVQGTDYDNITLYSPACERQLLAVGGICEVVNSA